MGLNKLSSEHIESEVLTLTYETSSYKDRFETKIQAKFDWFYQLSSKLVGNKVLTLTSVPPYVENHSDIKFQSKPDIYYQSVEKHKEELIEFKGKQQ